LGFWLYVAGAILSIYFSLGGDFAATGWLCASRLCPNWQFSPGVGVDYWIWSLQISGLGTLIGGINFLVTILKMRAPGMTLMKMPLFVWTSLCSMVLVVSVFPILRDDCATVAGSILRHAFFYFQLWRQSHDVHQPHLDVGPSGSLHFDSAGIWHLFRIVSTFSQKKIFGYVSLVCGSDWYHAPGILVWLHHFFTMGAGADVNAFFGIMTMIIAIPTGCSFQLAFTMYRGRIIYHAHVLVFGISSAPLPSVVWPECLWLPRLLITSCTTVCFWSRIFIP
jgi:cytochrome o ubiquinol oxidase subunit 1